MQNIFIGADGGGTKTKLIVENAAGELIGSAESGSANIHTSTEQAWHSIYTGITAALVNTDIQLDNPLYHFHIGLGLAGTEDHIAREQFLAKKHPFTTLDLDSDAYAACLAAHDCQDGAIIIIGTGVIGYTLAQGQRFSVGGWGFPHSDTGGGAWLGMEAIRLVFRWIDGQVQESPLLLAIFQHFNADINFMVTWSNRATPGDFAKIAPYVIKHLALQDKHAVALIKESAGEIDCIAAALERKLPVEHVPLNCCLLGGIAPFIMSELTAELQARLVPRKYEPPKGAIFMIRKKVFGKY